MPVSFLPSLRSKQSRGPNFGNLNSPDSGGVPMTAPSFAGPSVPAPAAAAPAPATNPFPNPGGEGYGGGGIDPNNSGYGKTDSIYGMLGFPGALQLAGMIAAPNATSLADAYFGGKPTSIASKISDAFDTSVVDPSVVAPGKQADSGVETKGEYSGKGDVADPSLEGGTPAPGKGGVAEGGAKGDAGPSNEGPGGASQGTGTGTEDQGGTAGIYREGGAVPEPGMGSPPGPPPGMNPQPVPATLHTGEFVLRPEITQAIGPELLTAVNSGIIPPDILAETLMMLLEQYDPSYNDQPMPIAGPNGTMMPGGGNGIPPPGDRGTMMGAGNAPPTPSMADPMQMMTPPPGIPPEEDAPVHPGYRMGGAVLNRAERPWHTDNIEAPLNYGATLDGWREDNEDMDATMDVSMPGMRQYPRRSAMRPPPPEQSKASTEKRRFPVPPYRPQHEQSPMYRYGGHVSAMRGGR